MRISGTDLYIPKGDTTKLILNIEGEDTSEYDFYMFVSNNSNLIKADIEGSELKFKISDNYTDKSGQFFYDIIMVRKDKNNELVIRTLINKGLFIIEEPFSNKVVKKIFSGKNPEVSK